MAKKRKAGGGSGKPARADDYGDNDKRVKMNIRTYADVADSEDEWDLGRDKVLLEEGPSRKRQRQLDEQQAELEESGDEILDVPDEEDLEADSGDDRMSGNEEDEDMGDADRAEDDEEGWGAGEAYGADEAENEEDAKEIEAEAIRLQKRRLQGMTDADFGFDEAEWLDQGQKQEDADGALGKHVEKLPDIEVTDEMSAEERMRVLKARYPEFEPLARELMALQSLAEQLRPEAEDAQRRYNKRRKLLQDDDDEQNLILPTAIAQFSALTGYIVTLAMYFAVLTSPAHDDSGPVKPLDPKELREHSIMEALIRSRNLWAKFKDLDPSSESDSDDDGSDGPEEISDATAYYTPVESPADKGKRTEQQLPQKDKRRKLTRAEKLALKAQADAKAKQDAQLRKLDEDMARVTENIASSKRSKSTTIQTSGGDDSDFGDATALTAHEAQEKARRKKTLRFYTSQIAQKAKRRDAAIANTGGDADIPHRERMKDRVARLNAEAEARGRKKGAVPADELGGSSEDEDDREAATAVRDTGNDEADEYYQTIQSRTSAKKAADSARREAQKEAVLRGARVQEVETVGEDGKRAIGYTIEKNKGLTPNRKKSVRNPRKKKREAYEKKQKKLGSMRQVYKGGEGRGGYGGELTGIKKGIVRATKL